MLFKRCVQWFTHISSPKDWNKSLAHTFVSGYFSSGTWATQFGLHICNNDCNDNETDSDKNTILQF